METEALSLTNYYYYHKEGMRTSTERRVHHRSSREGKGEEQGRRRKGRTVTEVFGVRGKYLAVCQRRERRRVLIYYSGMDLG